MVLKDAIVKLQAHAQAAWDATVYGDTHPLEAPPMPPEGNAGFPFCVCYPGNGNVTTETIQVRKDLATVFMDFHMGRENLPVNVEAALLFYDEFPTRLIADPTLDGTVSTIVLDGEGGGIGWQFGELSYATVKTIGYRFTINLKLRTP